MIEYTLFIFACLWAFFFIKLKENFSKKTNFILTIFVIKISYITLIYSIFFGISNFGLKKTFISLIVTFILIEILFFIGKEYLYNKNQLLDKVIKIKNFVEYAIIGTFTIYILNKFY
tara:strand:- start:89 stop:439 length:351 start_codon:yes stop_codon:yes gene_type:complete